MTILVQLGGKDQEVVEQTSHGKNQIKNRYFVSIKYAWEIQEEKEIIKIIFLNLNEKIFHIFSSTRESKQKYPCYNGIDGLLKIIKKEPSYNEGKI